MDIRGSLANAVIVPPSLCETSEVSKTSEV
jgi:hypothetical protein